MNKQKPNSAIMERKDGKTHYNLDKYKGKSLADMLYAYNTDRDYNVIVNRLLISTKHINAV